MSNNKLQVIEPELKALEPQFTQLTLSNEAKVVFTQELHFAMQALQKNEYLALIAMRNPTSLKNAILNVAAVGLTLNPVEKQAYLVPRDGAVVLEISYMGLADIATQEGALNAVSAQLIHKNDDFQYNGPFEMPVHKFNPFGERGEKVGVYIVAKTATGETLCDFMTIEECHSIRNRTDIWRKKQSGPWKTDEGEMMKKTIVKRHSKLWPKPRGAKRLQAAVDVLHSHEGIDFEREREEAEEARKLQIQERQDAQRLEQMEKEETLEEIKVICASITEGWSPEEKGLFMNERLGVTKFTQLHGLSLDELNQILDNLKNNDEYNGETNDGNVDENV